MFHLAPFGEYVVVQRLEAESRTPGGIYLSDNAKEKPQRGMILAVSPELPEGAFKVGQEVIFSKYGGHDFTIDGTPVMLLKRDEVLARIVPGEWPAPKTVSAAKAAKPARRASAARAS